MLFPTSGEELNEAYLSDALGCTVESFTAQSIGAGLVGDSARITLVTPDGPSSIAAKFPAADAVSRQTASSLGIYRKEVGFYRDIAPHVGIRVPEALHTEFDEVSGAFLLLMEDMGPCRQGDQLSGCSLDDAKHCLRQIARLHAPSWHNEALLNLDWVQPDPAIRQFAGGLFPGATERFCEFYSGRMDADLLAICARLGEMSGALFSETPATGPAIIHGDFRLDNILFDIRGGSEPVATLDWQTIALGDPLVDVGYFMGAGIGTALREAHEDELLGVYREELAQAGGPRFDADLFRRGYARGAVHGISTAIFSWAHVKVTDRSADVFQSMAEGACTLARDVDALAILQREWE